MEPAWRLIPAAEAQPALPSANVRARGWLRTLIERTRGEAPKAADPAPPEERLGPLEEARLARLAPEPPAADQRAALDTLRGHTGRAIVLRPDDGGWDTALDAETPAGADRIAPPDAGSNVATLPRELEARLADPAPLHLARLERWFVRHHAGLDTLRQLLSALREREGPWSADVGPWAWAWIRNALAEARALPAPWTPAPLDGDALAQWLGTGERLRLRSDGQPPGSSAFQALAARSHGEAGTASAIWRACLRDGAELAETERAESERADTEQDEREPDDRNGIVWMRHPGAVKLPSLASTSRTDLLVVYALLLHGGATIPRLSRALGTAAGPLDGTLARLAANGIVERRTVAAWGVTPLALPSARSRLEAEAFPGWAA